MEFLTDISSHIYAGIIGLITYLAATKQRKAETESLYLTNMNKGFSMYEKLLDDLKEKYDKEISEMKVKLSKLKDQYSLIETNNANLREKIQKLIKDKNAA